MDRSFQIVIMQNLVVMKHGVAFAAKTIVDLKDRFPKHRFVYFQQVQCLCNFLLCVYVLKTVWYANIALFKEKAASGFRAEKKQVRITTIYGDTQLNDETTFG